MVVGLKIYGIAVTTVVYDEDMMDIDTLIIRIITTTNIPITKASIILFKPTSAFTIIFISTNNQYNTNQSNVYIINI